MTLILVIDDSNLARGAIRKILTPEGYEILEASSGEEGQKMLSQHAPDCILMDLLMPGISGMDILTQLNSTGSSTPVIVITADIQDSVRSKCLELGAFAVINKHLLFETLLGTVKEALVAKDT
jgi:CheY-like chemotaxis protein